MSKSRAPSLSPVVAYKVPLSSIELAGGPEAMNERFASRLQGFLRDRGDAFEVECAFSYIAAKDRNSGATIVINFHAWEWEARDSLVAYRAFAWDKDLDMFHRPGANLPLIDNPFRERFAALCALVADWPEVESVETRCGVLECA